MLNGNNLKLDNGKSVKGCLIQNSDVAMGDNIIGYLLSGKVWEPYLQGIITLGDDSDTYQPFVFNVSYSPLGKTDSFWFSYYKDLREEGGRLKLGYGPGGPPVLHKDTLKELIKTLLQLEIMTRQEIKLLLD